mgnify:CR=1 FL=1
MKKLLTLLVLLVSVFGLFATANFKETNAATPTTVYLDGSFWDPNSCRYAAYFFGNGEKWVSMTDSDGDGIYECAVPSGFTKVIFCRMNKSATANNWNNKWNQTGDLTIPTDGKNMFTVKQWDGQTSGWSVFTLPEPDPVKNGGDILYLSASHWNVDGAWFAAYFYQNKGDSNAWAIATDADGDGYFKVVVPTGEWDRMIVTRRNPDLTDIGWNKGDEDTTGLPKKVWNQTQGILFEDGKDLFTVKADEWDSATGSWSAASATVKDGEVLGERTNALNELINGYYNSGVYTKETIINLNETAVTELTIQNCWHVTSLLERVTYYNVDELWMSNHLDGYSYYGTSGSDMTHAYVKELGERTDKVAISGQTMEEYYYTLKDVVATTAQAWSVDAQGKYTSTNAEVIKWVKAIAAPCYLGFADDSLASNYITLTSVTIQQVGDTLVIQLHAKADDAKLTNGTIFAQATFTKGIPSLAE